MLRALVRENNPNRLIDELDNLTVLLTEDLEALIEYAADNRCAENLAVLLNVASVPEGVLARSLAATARQGDARSMTVLLEAGADPNNTTVVDALCSGGHLDMMMLLVKHGHGGLLIPDDMDDETCPFDMFIYNCHTAVCQYLYTPRACAERPDRGDKSGRNLGGLGLRDMQLLEVDDCVFDCLKGHYHKSNEAFAKKKLRDAGLIMLVFGCMYSSDTCSVAFLSEIAHHYFSVPPNKFVHNFPDDVLGEHGVFGWLGVKKRASL